jgi:hypothetical protein
VVKINREKIMKTLTSFLVVVATLGFASSTWADAHVYCGAIKAKKALPIILEISQNPKTKQGNSAQYFYRQYKQVIPLQVISKTGTGVTLAENSQGSKAIFSLTKDEFGAMSGYWDNGKIKLPVTLSEIDAPETLATYRQGIKPKKNALGSTEVERVPDPIYNYQFQYRITKYKDASKIPTLNQWLQSINSRALPESNETECDDILVQQSDKFDLVTEDILFADDRSTGMMPRAAYPLNNEGQNKYYDLATNSELTVDIIFTEFGKTQKNIIFAGKIKEALRNAKITKKDQDGNYIIAENDDGCWQSYLPELLDSADVSLEISLDKTKRRLGLAQSFSHANNVCNQDYQYVDTAKIVNYLNKNTAVYRFLIAAK